MSSDEAEKHILGKEIKSWKGFEHALREPNATLFNKMLKECLGNEEYAAAFKTKGPQVVLIYQDDYSNYNCTNCSPSQINFRFTVITYYLWSVVGILSCRCVFSCIYAKDFSVICPHGLS
jgi:hypothetical protein